MSTLPEAGWRLVRTCRSGLVLAVTLATTAGAQQRPGSPPGELITPAPQAPRENGPEPGGALFTGPHLDRVALVRAVLERNPTIAAARHAWRGASARSVQARALEDPTLDYTLSPLSAVSSDAPFGQQITLRQRFPWPGTLSLRERVAEAEAEATRGDYEATRLRLALMASVLFDEYFTVTRALTLNAEHRQLVEDLKDAALAQYAAGRASQQEPLQLDLELAHVVHQRVVLGARRRTLVAQLNALLHRLPETELPPPPRALEPWMGPLPDSAALQAEALEARPEIGAGRARIRGGESGSEVAWRAYYPDLGVMASYNSMWRMPEHQWMVGLSVEVPLQWGTRRAAVDEAEAGLAAARARLDALEAEVRAEVEEARVRLLEARHVLHLYGERLLPTARAQLEAARIAYTAGRGDFQGLIDAERSLRTLELGHVEAVAAVQKRNAELERTLGRVPGLREKGQER